MSGTPPQCDGGYINKDENMYTDPNLYLAEHQRHVARITAKGLRRLEATSSARPQRERTRLVERVSRRIRANSARPVAH